MATVFSAFILTPDRISKEFGLLLAVAILTDALIVKMTLIPAFFTLIGEKTWYIPRWLDKLLPNITIEPPHDGEEHPPPVSASRSRAKPRSSSDDFRGRRRSDFRSRRPRKDARMTLDSRTRWLALLIVCLGDLMIVLDVTIVGVAFRRSARTSASPRRRSHGS